MQKYRALDALTSTLASGAAVVAFILYTQVVEAAPAPQPTPPAETAKVPVPATSKDVIDLRQTYTDDKGKVIPNDTTREVGLVVVAPTLDVGDHHYVRGDKVTNPEAVRELLADAEARQIKFAAGPIDPECAKCAPLTLGWVLAQAAVAPICQARQGQKPSEACDASEQKAEQDVLVMRGRQDFAVKIRDYEARGMGMEFTVPQRDLLKRLVHGAVTNALVAADTLMMLDPAERPVEFGKPAP